jgi:hypothetical protein
MMDKYYFIMERLYNIIYTFKKFPVKKSIG